MKIFAMVVGGFSPLRNHLHRLLMLDLTRAKAWTAEEVVRRWLLLCSLKDCFGNPDVVTAAWIVTRAQEMS